MYTYIYIYIYSCICSIFRQIMNIYTHMCNQKFLVNSTLPTHARDEHNVSNCESHGGADVVNWRGH